jgi:hypothetical protein
MHLSHSKNYEIGHELATKTNVGSIASSMRQRARAIRQRKNALQLSARLFSARYLADQMPITIGYWNIRGLAAPLRMLASYAGPTSACRPHLERLTRAQVKITSTNSTKITKMTMGAGGDAIGSRTASLSSSGSTPSSTCLMSSTVTWCSTRHLDIQALVHT